MEVVDKRYAVTCNGTNGDGSWEFRQEKTGEILLVKCKDIIGSSILQKGNKFMLRQLPGGSCVVEGNA